jgi:hypothetical protein
MVRSVRLWTSLAGATVPKRMASGRCSSAITIVPVGSDVERPSNCSPSVESRRPSRPLTWSASNACTATPTSAIAIVSESSRRLRLLKEPACMRSSASCSAGVRVSSGSSPMCRKKTR